jgi:hypothetical protein
MEFNNRNKFILLFHPLPPPAGDIVPDSSGGHLYPNLMQGFVLFRSYAA